MRNRLAAAGLTAVAALTLSACATPPGILGAGGPTSQPTTAPATTPPSEPTSQPPATTAAPAQCSAAMIAYESARAEGAAGTAYFTYFFHDAASRSCFVQGTPVLTYVDDHGATLTMPVQHDPVGGQVLLQPGDKVQFVMHHINGYGGYAPGAPQCAHPATYNHVAVSLPGGSVSLGADGTMSVQCGSITLGSWGRPT